MNSTFQPLTDLPLTVSVRRVVALAAVAGYVEVIGFLDIDVAWISYSIGAGAGATATVWVRLPLLVPIVVLVFTVVAFVGDKRRSR
jgi:uncharacterized membrane protein YoaK (UPF0700 family)